MLSLESWDRYNAIRKIPLFKDGADYSAPHLYLTLPLFFGAVNVPYIVPLPALTALTL